MSTDTSPARWWLALDGRPDGPRTAAYVTAALQSGTISPMTPICAEGGHHWQPLGAHPDFAALAPAPSVGPPPLPPGLAAATSTVGDRLLTNPLLPPMANLICIYAIVIAPLYWIFGSVAALFTGDIPFLEGTGLYTANLLFEICDSVVMLGLVVLGVFGGIFLKMLGRDGVHWLLIALSSDIVWSAIYFLVTITFTIVGTVQNVMDESETPAWTMAFSFLYVLVALILFAFKIFATIWLIRCRRSLPLH